jgi:hypothetical protein
MTTMRRRKSNSKSKAAKIRKLLVQGELTSTEIANKVKVSANYVYIIKGQMKQKGLIGGAQEEMSRVHPPADPTAIPVPTSSGKRGRPPKRIEPKLEGLSEPLPVYIPAARQNPFGIEATPPVGLWNTFIAKLRKWLA